MLFTRTSSTRPPHLALVVFAIVVAGCATAPSPPATVSESDAQAADQADLMGHAYARLDAEDVEGARKLFWIAVEQGEIADPPGASSPRGEVVEAFVAFAQARESSSEVADLGLAHLAYVAAMEFVEDPALAQARLAVMPRIAEAHYQEGVRLEGLGDATGARRSYRAAAFWIPSYKDTAARLEALPED